MVTIKGYLLTDQMLKWSPDGEKVAFTKADDNDKSQLFLKIYVERYRNKEYKLR